MNGRVRPKPFAGDHYDLALAGLRFGSAAVDLLRFPVRRFDVATGVHAIDFDFAGQLGLVGVVNLGTHRFAQFVRQHEGRFVLAIEIAAELEGGYDPWPR